LSSILTNKTELINAIESAYNKLHLDYVSIPEELTRIKGVEGNIKGTLIGVSDTLAYLIGWGKLVLKWYYRKSRNESVDFPATGFKWNELGLLAQHFHGQYKAHSYQELLTEFSTTTTEILALINSLDNQSLYNITWYKQWTLARMVQLNTSSPVKNIRTKVRKFKRLNHLI